MVCRIHNLISGQQNLIFVLIISIILNAYVYNKDRC